MLQKQKILLLEENSRLRDQAELSEKRAAEALLVSCFALGSVHAHVTRPYGSMLVLHKTTCSLSTIKSPPMQLFCHLRELSTLLTRWHR